VALVVVPLGVWLVALVSGALITLIWLIRLHGLTPPTPLPQWSLLAWVEIEAYLLLALLISLLWFAPLAAYLVLVSSWARRVFIWATLLPLFAILLERLVFGTHFISDLIDYRTFGIWQSVHLSSGAQREFAGSFLQALRAARSPFDVVDITPAFANIDLWSGVAVAGLLGYAASSIRRYRDDA
jgi:hypothetical protein